MIPPMNGAFLDIFDACVPLPELGADAPLDVPAAAEEATLPALEAAELALAVVELAPVAAELSTVVAPVVVTYVVLVAEMVVGSGVPAK